LFRKQWYCQNVEIRNQPSKEIISDASRVKVISKQMILITRGSTSIAESIHDRIGNHHEVAREHSVRSIQESIHAGVLTGAWQISGHFCIQINMGSATDGETLNKSSK